MELGIEQKTKQLRKGILELAILTILSKGEGYGYNIVETIKQGGIQIAEGTVYPILSRLKNEGAISYRWEESVKGPPRKYYFLTDQGAELLKVLKSEWLQLNHSLNQIMGVTNK
ncbi:MAG: PadR family transcriptional regulator [Candidatus Riflebacteria bacterium]|nr:PadR family transcriptional regulator [Candidatus Riflebacteria bacterium]